jgi:hypothetical protein
MVFPSVFQEVKCHARYFEFLRARHSALPRLLQQKTTRESSLFCKL